jgi:hypothetical protein
MNNEVEMMWVGAVVAQFETSRNLPGGAEEIHDVPGSRCRYFDPG